MKPVKLMVLIATIFCLVAAISCQHQDEESSDPVFVTLMVQLDSRNYQMTPAYLLSSGTSSAMISAVADSISTVTGSTDLSSAYDRQMLTIADDTVTLLVPLETSIRLVKAAYQDELTRATILADNPTPLFIGLSDPFTITSATTTKSVEVVMQEVVAVSSTNPADAATDVAVGTTIAVTFNHAMDTATVTTNTGSTDCTGSLQLSSNSFSTCIAMDSTPVASGSDRIFTITPASNLDYSTTFQVKVTTAVQSVISTALESTSTTSFTTTALTTQLIGEGMQGQALSLSGVVTTLAGSGVYGHGDDTGIAAVFGDPHDICMDGTYLYVVDKGYHYIRKIVIATGEVTTIAGDGTAGYNDAIGTAAQFNAPAGITTDGTYLYIADQINHVIRKITIPTGFVSTLAGDGTIGSNDGIGTAARFNWPTGITGSGGILYIADMENHLIRKLVISTGEVTTLAGDGTSGFQEGTGTAAKLSIPHDLTTDGTNLYVTDQNNHRIRKIVISTGVVSTLVGDGVQASVDGTGAAAQLNTPEGITTDGTYLYFTDWGANTGTFDETVLRRTEISTGVTTTVAGGATGGGGCDGNDTWCQNGTGTAVQFNWAHDLTTDGTYLYLADFYNHRIRRIE